ncbi:DUF551 domain-containing protein [Klebsiella africana]|uniref:DUF551 domain-containing protein n=1 Tax=Klebsiella africana TaxID=2489010 RepID=UPI001933F831|nr:DUF551 domain-containing protein [Klebsiella africana]QRF11475.1 DUF551 domain-containing protein [Klebsiella africana]
MTSITKERLLTIKQWRETYGPGSNVVLPAEEAEELARIALASLAAVSDERAAYELFMEKRFGESVDRRRAKNGDREYMAWDMALGWIIWCHRAAMLHGAKPVSQTYKLNKLSGNSPVTPDGWISCSERMPNDKQYVWCWGKSYGWTECDTFEGYYDWSRNKWWAVTDDGEEQASKVTHWMPLPEPPQELKKLCAMQRR